MSKYMNHFKTVTIHKWYVFKLMCKCGMPIQGFIHDMSKYSPVEFMSSAKYWDGKRSPIDNEKDAKGYSEAWQHHKGHNPHHQEYWMDNVMMPNEECVALLMPKRYVIELICDWLSAGMSYEKGNWEYDTPINWYHSVGKHRRYHPVVLGTAKFIFEDISNHKNLGAINKSYISYAYDMMVKIHENGDTIHV